MLNLNEDSAVCFGRFPEVFMYGDNEVNSKVVMRFLWWAGKRGPYPGYTEGSVATGETRRLSLDSELKQGGHFWLAK